MVTPSVISSVIELCIVYFRSQRKNIQIRIKSQNYFLGKALVLNFARIQVVKSHLAASNRISD